MWPLSLPKCLLSVTLQQFWKSKGVLPSKSFILFRKKKWQKVKHIPHLVVTVAHNCHGKTKNCMAKTKTSQQNQKPYGKNKDLMAKTNTSEQKPNTSQQKQTLMAKPKLFCFCCEVFGFAVMFLFLLWGILFLPWGFWFCHEVFCFCCEVFGFAVIFWFLQRAFWFCRNSCGPP